MPAPPVSLATSFSSDARLQVRKLLHDEKNKSAALARDNTAKVQAYDKLRQKAKQCGLKLGMGTRVWSRFAEKDLSVTTTDELQDIQTQLRGVLKTVCTSRYLTLQTVPGMREFTQTDLMRFIRRLRLQ